MAAGDGISVGMDEERCPAPLVGADEKYGWVNQLPELFLAVPAQGVRRKETFELLAAKFLVEVLRAAVFSFRLC